MHTSIGKNLTGNEAKAQTYVLKRLLGKGEHQKNDVG